MEEAGGLEDHIAGIRQLAAVRPYMDISRVGIYGHFGRRLCFDPRHPRLPPISTKWPSPRGNHDQRGYLAGWGDSTRVFSKAITTRPKPTPAWPRTSRGKLLLVHGDMG